MIECYFSTDGYYMYGDHIESVRHVAPLCGDDGNIIFDDLQHQYLVLFAMLGELVQRKLGYHVINVYNASRIIDDMNGGEPVDTFSLDVKTQIIQRILPQIDGRVHFRKKPEKAIREKINTAQNELLVPQNEMKKIAHERREEFEHLHVSRVNQLRERWARMMEKKYGTS